jgi:hypothetical protein
MNITHAHVLIMWDVIIFPTKHEQVIAIIYWKVKGESKVVPVL